MRAPGETLYLDAGVGTATASGHEVERYEVGSQPIDRRAQLAFIAAGVEPGGTLGEHALHAPWALRWGLGAALGAAFMAWLWDAIKRR
jgi:hypothetical protein